MTRNRILQHPDKYREDLNPDYEAGENYGPPVYETLPASEIKEIVQQWSHLNAELLQRIPVVCEGGRLEQGAVYFDLRHPERGEIRALGCMEAGPENWYVPKSETDYEVWNVLLGVDDPDRLGGLAEECLNEDEFKPEPITHVF